MVITVPYGKGHLSLEFPENLKVDVLQSRRSSIPSLGEDKINTEIKKNLENWRFQQKS